MRIALLLPNYSGNVVGSIKVAYRFAEIAAQAGHQVEVFHPAMDEERRDLRSRIRGKIWAWRKSATRRPVPWHSFGPGVVPTFIVSYSRLRIEHDIAVAFTWRSIEALAKTLCTGRQVGYVMEYETWANAAPQLRSRMESAYLAGHPLLCSSRVVETMLHQAGAVDVRKSYHGVDVDALRSEIGPELRDPTRIGFPVRTEAVKAPEVLARALEILRDRMPRTALWGFGRSYTPRHLTALFDEFHADPSDALLKELYGRSAIFAVPSHIEGFGMPAAEAMAAGCAVVSTDNGGIRTFGVHEGNCLLVAPGDASKFAEAILDLVHDHRKRIALATHAPDSVRSLRWEFAGERFLDAIGRPRT